jgi:hypothetical protein
MGPYPRSPAPPAACHIPTGHRQRALPPVLRTQHVHQVSAHSPRALVHTAPTVGELRTAEICVSYMPSLQAKKLEKLTQEKAVLER